VASLLRRFSRAPADREIRAELDAFVDLLTREKVATGMESSAARREALREAGGLQQTTEELRDLRPSAWIDRLVQDGRQGLRILFRAPGLSAAVVLTLALGIGATSVTFSVVDNVLVKPLGYADADELVVILHNGTGPVSPANYLDWQRLASGFTGMAAAEYWTPNLGAVAEPEQVFALRVTNNLLPLLGVRPVLGRFPAPLPGGSHEVVIRHSLWQRAFGGRPDVIGRRITLDGLSFEIVGVMPADFAFAPFWATRAELWAPLDLSARAGSRDGQSLRVFARLADDTSLAQARASMASLTATLEAAFPGSNRDITVTPLKERVVGTIRPAIVALFSAVVLVLLIACANVAHLLLARASGREREVAMRAALGAPRRRLIRQLLIESLILSATGALGGLVLALGGVQAVRLLGAASIPRVQSVVLDERVVLFTAGLSVLTAIAFGLAPAIRSSRPNLMRSLHGPDRGTTSDAGHRRLRGVLIASEVAVGVVLVASTLLLVRSFTAMRSVDTGWNPAGVGTFVVSAVGSSDDVAERRALMFGRVLERLRAVPGLASVSAINHLPLGGDIWGLGFSIPGRPAPRPGEGPAATFRAVMPDYFTTMRLPIVRGRAFTEADRLGASDVVIVNEFMAARHWPGEDAIGQRLQSRADASGVERTIIGIARDAVRSDLREPADEEIYIPLLQDRSFLDGAGMGSRYLTYVFRTAGQPAALILAARDAVREVAPTATIANVTTMEDVVAGATSSDRFLIVLVSAFAGLALVLAAVGIYGVMSYTVSLQRREMEIRLALGAQPGWIIGRVVGRGLVGAVAGAAVGVAFATLASEAMAPLLYRVETFDFVAPALAALALLALAASACYLPARRIARLDLTLRPR
jgi:putative ABC transport system permease protein